MHFYLHNKNRYYIYTLLRGNLSNYLINLRHKLIGKKFHHYSKTSYNGYSLRYRSCVCSRCLLRFDFFDGATQPLLSLTTTRTN